MKIRALAASTAIALAAPVVAQPVEPVAPTTVVTTTIVLGEVAPGDGNNLQVAVAARTGVGIEFNGVPMVMVIKQSLMRPSTLFTAAQAQALAMQIDRVAEQAESGTRAEEIAPRTTVQAQRGRDGLEIQIIVRPMGNESNDLPVITCTLDGAYSLARILRRAAGNAAWLKDRIPALRAD